MPIIDTAQAYALHRLAGWRLISDQPQKATSGWDTTRLVYAANRPASAGFQIASEWAIGRKLPGLNMFLVDVAPRPLGGGIWSAEVTGQGLLAARLPRVSGSAATIQRSLEDLNAFGTIYPKAEVWESTPTLEVEVINATAPETHLVGTEMRPTQATAVRRSIWSFIQEPTFHFPNGWVLADLRYERLLNKNLWLKVYVWEYRYAFTP
jgi:hypothetical protein